MPLGKRGISMKTITYPRQGVSFEETVSQQNLNRLTSQLLEWQQGPGTVGGLILHACWGETSVLRKRYQGHSVSMYYGLMHGSMTLYEHTGNPRWRRFAADIASNLLYLQCPDGGFRHASGEFEPTYNSYETCPIHQNMPILALLDYAGWEHADPVLKEFIKPAVDRHWEYFNKRFWLVGNAWQRPLKTEAGWCGVTNQDLVAVAALTAYGRLYGDFSWYNDKGKRVLDVYLSPTYYHEQMGLFERGDAANFVERTPYYNIILQMLTRIYQDVGDERLPAIIDNVTRHLFDAVYTAPDGMTHLAWGAVTDPVDKSRVVDWIRTPVVFGDYPALIGYMEDFLRRHPDPAKQAIVDSLKQTVAAYTFWDGSLPASLWPKDPIIAVVTTPAGFGGRWRWLIEQLAKKGELQDPAEVEPICLHRQLGAYTWKTKGPLWAIERDGQRVFGGYKPVSHGVTHGQEPSLAGDYAQLDQCDVLEILSF